MFDFLFGKFATKKLLQIKIDVLEQKNAKLMERIASVPPTITYKDSEIIKNFAKVSENQSSIPAITQNVITKILSRMLSKLMEDGNIEIEEHTDLLKDQKTVTITLKVIK
jgi:hypothetical protein